MANLNELNKLEKWLRENDYNVERFDEFNIPFSRHQVIVLDESGKRAFDVVCHPGSYGFEAGLLEIMNGTMKLCGFEYDVEGWLTADEIIKRLQERR